MFGSRRESLIGLLHRVSHARTPTVKIVKRIDGMMQRDDERLVGGRGGEFVGKPLLLDGVDHAALRNVGVHADDRRERTVECEVDVWLRERGAGRVLRLRIDVRVRLHEITYPPVQRSLRAVDRVAVVVPRN